MEKLICLNCGKEIEKEWRKDQQVIKISPLRFCCLDCSRAYTIKNRKKGIVSKKACPICNKDIGATAFNRHYKACMNGYKSPSYKAQPKDEHGKTQTWYDAMHKRKGHGTNQFTKAKELGLPTPIGCWKGKEGPWKGKQRSEESKKKTSDTMKRKIAEGTFTVPYKRNHSSKISFPEKYFMEVFKDLPIKYNYQVGLYQLDFAIPEKKVYIEIDGEQHFVDKKIVEHDKERTKKLESLGWKCLQRVRWASYKKLKEAEQKSFCETLIKLLTE